MTSYLGPNPMPASVAPAGPVRLGPLTWSGGAPVLTVDGLGMMVMTAGTLSNTGRGPVDVAVQPVNSAGTSTGAVIQRTLAAGAHWTLADPPAAGGWIIVALTSQGARVLVAGMLVAGALGAGLAVYGGYAAVRDLKRRHRAPPPKAGR